MNSNFSNHSSATEALGAIGARIQNARAKAGLTQAQLCVRAGVSRKTLSSLETGKIEEVGLRKVLTLCSLLGLAFQIESVDRSKTPYPTLEELSHERRA